MHGSFTAQKACLDIQVVGSKGDAAVADVSLHQWALPSLVFAGSLRPSEELHQIFSSPAMGLGGKDSQQSVCNATGNASWWPSAFRRKQNRRSSDAWVQPSAVKEIVAKREPLAFLSDDEITSSWAFRITQWFWLTYAAILHGINALADEFRIAL